MTLTGGEKWCFLYVWHNRVRTALLWENIHIETSYTDLEGSRRVAYLWRFLPWVGTIIQPPRCSFACSHLRWSCWTVWTTATVRRSNLTAGEETKELAMVRIPFVKAARCVQRTTDVWTASPSSSCSWGGRGWGSTASVSMPVRQATTACAGQRSTCAPGVG